MTNKKNYGICPICLNWIEIPGEDGYLCSSRKCGAEIVIRDKKKKVVSRHPAKGWVKKYDLQALVKKASAKKSKLSSEQSA